MIVSAQQRKLELKRDVLRRIAGNRHIGLPKRIPPPPNGEPYVALNEAFIVFADDTKVLQALQDLRRHRPARTEDFVAVVKRMASAAGVPINLDDAYINSAFYWSGYDASATPTQPVAPGAVSPSVEAGPTAGAATPATANRA